MSAVATACTCQSIGAPPEIRQCPEHFSFWHGDRRLTSYSSMLKAIYPAKAEALAKIPPAILAHAAERGKRVDRYASDYARGLDIEVNPADFEDGAMFAEVLERVRIFVEWFDHVKPEVIGVQQICYSLDDGIAAMKDFDFRIEGAMWVVDLKCTATPAWEWKLQLGCHYALSASASYCDPLLGILHINPKLYPRTNGVELIEYSTEPCLKAFQHALDWWKEIQ